MDSIKGIPVPKINRNGHTYVAGAISVTGKQINTDLEHSTIDVPMTLGSYYSGDSSYDINIYYFRDVRNEPIDVKVKYLDSDDGNRVVDEKTISGKVGENVAVPADIPENYEYQNKGSVPTKILLTESLRNDPTPLEIYLVHVKKEVQVTKDVSRTVVGINPKTNAEFEITKQTAHFTGHIVKDMVTGKTTDPEWDESPIVLDKVTPTAILGYSPDTAEVASFPVTAEMESFKVTVHYTANDGTQTIIYRDKTDGDVGKQTVDGKTDQTVAVTPEIPDGYEVTGDVPETVTIKDKDTPIIVEVVHGTIDIQPDNPKDKDDPIPGTEGKLFPAGLTRDDLNKTVTRVVNIIDPHTQKTTTTTQEVIFKRSATLDKVTLKVTYHPWSENGTHTFDKVDVPQVPGYVASSDVPSLTVTPDSKSTTVTVTYNGNAQSTTITYVDDDRNGQTVGSPVVIAGKTGQTVATNIVAPENYVLAPSQDELPKQITFTDKAANPIVVHLKHKIIEVTHDDPKEDGTVLPDNPDLRFDGVSHDDLNKTVTRTVNITDPSGKKTTSVQTVTFTRDATVDEVTGKVTYDNWSENGKHTFDKVDVPTVPGYTASQNEVPATEVTSDMTDQTIDISYTANSQTIHINYVDDDNAGKIVHATTVTGKTGETVSLNLTVPDKYQLADGQQLPTTYTFAAYNDDVTIDLTHKVVQREATVDVQIGFVTLVDVGDEIDPAIVVTQNQWTQLDDEIKKSYTTHLEKVYPTVGVVGTLTGHVNYDLVDNKVVSFADDWTSLNLGGQTYQMPNGTEVVNGMFIKSDLTWGKTLKEEFLKYHSDTDPDYVNRAWHGYLSANETNEVVPDFTNDNLQVELVGDESNELAKAIGDQAATVVKIANELIDSNWLKVHFDKQQFSEQNGQLRADGFVPVVGVYIPYVEKTATRTINVTTPDGKTTTVKQTATLAKQVDFGKNAHRDWTTGEWTSYDVPIIPGYTASQSNVAKEAVTGTTKDQTVNITYTANDGTQTIIYQDEGGSEVSKQVIPGKTDETIKVTPEIPAGYIVKTEILSEVIIKPKDNPIVVTVGHKIITIEHTNPVDKGQPIPGGGGLKYPAGLSKGDLNRTIVREIEIDFPSGKKSITAQSVTFTRDATLDLATGEVTYKPWSENGKHTFAKVEAPEIKGYTPSGDAPEIVVTPNDQAKILVKITYAKTQGTQSVIYVDDHGSTVGSQVVTGKVGESIDFVPTIPTGYVAKTGIPGKLTIQETDTPIYINVIKKDTDNDSGDMGGKSATPDVPLAPTQTLKQPMQITGPSTSSEKFSYISAKTPAKKDNPLDIVYADKNKGKGNNQAGQTATTTASSVMQAAQASNAPDKQAGQLPQTGADDGSAIVALGLVLILSAAGLAARKRS